MTARKFVIAAVAALTLGSTAQAMEVTDITPTAGPQSAAEMSWFSTPAESWWWFFMLNQW